MKAIGDKIRLPDGRRGTIIGVAVPIAAWKGSNGRLMMEKRNRELEVEVANKDGSATRVFVMEEDQRGILVPVLLALLTVAASVFLVWFGVFR